MQVTINPQKEVEEYAISVLEGDRQNPDVGMGMFPHTAVQYAMEYFVTKYGEEFANHVNEKLAIKNIVKRYYKS